MQSATPKFGEWLVADKNARDATRQLWAEASSLSGDDAAARAALFQDAAAKQVAASILFRDAMKEIKRSPTAILQDYTLDRR